jgi:ATP-dependent Clp protease ATP-binding subunit ClpC
VRWSDRFINDRFLPDKAIDLIDEAASRVAQQAPKTNGEGRALRREARQLNNGLQGCIDTQQFEAADILAEQLCRAETELVQALVPMGAVNGYAIPLVTEEDIAAIVASKTGIPVQMMTTPARQRLLNLESDLRRRIIGQEHAVVAVARAIRRSHAGTRSPNRPIASFIFAGPTGVGKTELVKALAATEFGDEESIIRLDMSEFMERGTVSKLIGAAPGYIGYEDGGQLTEAVRRRPYAVVLLDEVEKAHPDVFNLLLQVLEDGRLTDSQGRTVDFCNTVIVMTTNIGSRVIQQRATGGLGFEMSEDSPAEAEYRRIQGAVHEELGRYFRPEFLNRVDEILVFRVLNREEVRQIAEILVREVEVRLAEKGIALASTPRFLDHLATVGWNPTYGARPLRRAVMRLLEDCLAEAILRGEIDSGRAEVDWNPDEGRVVLSTSIPADLSVCR